MIRKMSQVSNVVAEEYASSLSDLMTNSKPLINMLTMLAEENIDHAPAIVQAVEKHLQKVRSEIKLPVLYLIDSIVKNVGKAYTTLFTQNIVSTFCSVFEKVDERTRGHMYKLRQTWNEVFPVKKLYAMDLRVSSIDPAWPITAPVPASRIHFNPKFLKASPVPPVITAPVIPPPAPVEDPQVVSEAKMREQLLKRQKKLLELQQKKLELELLQTKAKLEEQQKQLERQTDTLQVQQLLAPSIQAAVPEAAKQFTSPPFVTVKPEVPVSLGKDVPSTSSAVPVQASVAAVVPASSSTSTTRSHNKHKNDTKSRSAAKQTTTVSSARSRDPRLATRQTVPQSNVTIDHAHATPQPPPTQENTNTVFESVKLETAKPKHITINIANKGNVNKETQGVSKKDPRLIRNKVHVSNSKERTVGSVGNVGVDKVTTKSRGPSPSSPSHSGKTVPSLRKTSSKGNNANNSKIPIVKTLSSSVIDLTDSPPHKVADKKEAEVSGKKDKESHSGAGSKTSSPSKLDNHKKKSPLCSNSTNSSSSRQLPSDKKKGSSKTSENAGSGGSSSKRTKSPTGGNKGGSRERPSPKKYIFEQDVESPSPPPPPVISEGKKKEETTFKEVKVSKKSRNYVRRNRQDESRSPEPAVMGTTGDVDLRQGGPPEKHPRLTTFQPNSEPVVSAVEEDAKKTLVDATAKDIDLRQLQRSPCKKRPSVERADKQQPPPKKTKAEIIDGLFGSEDVDLRQLAPMPVSTQSSMPPSPPPPPIISHPSPLQTTTSSQDTTNTISSPKMSIATEKDREESGEKIIAPLRNESDDQNKENNGDKICPQGWEKYKESKPDIYKSPFRAHELSKSEVSTETDSPNTGVPYVAHQDRNATHFSRRPRPEFDRLGRRLLYHRLPDDPGLRRNSLSFTNPLSPPYNEDTDMRTHLVDSESGENMDISMNVIISQAQEQVKNGLMTLPQYNTLLHQVIQINEIHKLREAQRRDEMESKSNWESVHTRREIGKDSPRGRDEGSRGNSPAGARFGDIDERFPVLSVHNPPASGPSPEPPQPPASNNLPTVPTSQWNELSSHHPRPVIWDQHPPPWLRGPPGPGRSISPGPMPPHIRMLHPGPFHRQPTPGQDFTSGPNVVGRWRSPAPQFSSRVPFEGDGEGRYDRFGLRFPGPPQPPLQPSQLHQQPPLHQLRPQPPSQTTEEQHFTSNGELPPADPVLLELIAQDTMRTINIDGTPREIRYYGDVAIVMLAWDDPREILFQNGSRRVSFDDRETVLCAFNDAYRDFILDGHTHRIRLGAPTRELYIDGQWYECFFGGPPIPIELDGKLRMVKLEGPPPPVKIGFAKRTDLVAGKINLIINARTMVPIFLDAKPQRFDIEGKPHVVRFTHALSNVVINGRSFQVEFGGLPKLIVVWDKKHYIRFSVLPRGVRPGYINIVNMEGGRLPSPPHQDAESSDSLGVPSVSSPTEDSDEPKFRKGHEPVLPMLGPGGRGRGQKRAFGSDRDSPHDTDPARSSPVQLQSENTAVVSTGSIQQNQMKSGSTTHPLEMLASLIPVSMAPSCGFNYQVEQESQDTQSKSISEATASTSTSAPAETSTTTTITTSALEGIPFLLPDINVDELYKKLVASGIVPQSDSATPNEKKDDETNAVKPVDFGQPETLKVRQPGLVAALYSGIQCSSCGVRFPPEQTMKYSQHLDWHFRQNRRDKDNTRKAQSRKWYYDISDWIQFEEIEDLEERAQSWFETQQAAEGRTEEKEPIEIPSVPAGDSADDTICDVCHDKFEQFYNEEREEWHLRYAIRVEGKTYHPVCYEDYKISLETSNEESMLEDVQKAESKESDLVKGEENPENGDEKKPEEEQKTEVNTENESTSKPPAQEEMDTEDKTEEVPKTEEPIKEGDEAIEKIQTALEETQLEDKKELKEDQENEVSTIKSEPVEAEDEEEVPVVEIAPVVDTTHTEVACSIDGNVKFEDNVQLAIAAPLGGKIKINITKPIPVTKEPQNEVETESSTAECEVDTENKTTPCGESSETSEVVQTKVPEREIMEPPPPGVEPMQVKPRLVGRRLVEMPPVIKGTELSGLCTIM